MNIIKLLTPSESLYLLLVNVIGIVAVAMEMCHSDCHCPANEIVVRLCLYHDGWAFL